MPGLAYRMRLSSRDRCQEFSCVPSRPGACLLVDPAVPVMTHAHLQGCTGCRASAGRSLGAPSWPPPSPSSQGSNAPPLHGMSIDQGQKAVKSETTARVGKKRGKRGKRKSSTPGSGEREGGRGSRQCRHSEKDTRDGSRRHR